MESALILTWIVVLCLSTASSAHSRYYSESVHGIWKVTKLHFYLHETRGGPYNTVVDIAQAANVTITDPSSPVQYGSIRGFDDPLTVGIEDGSEVIGNAQGLGISPSKDTTSAVLYLDFGFTIGKFNGSSLSMFSRNRVTETVRELAVVGGKGKFQFANGIAQLETVARNSTTFVVEYNVTIIHYNGIAAILEEPHSIPCDGHGTPLKWAK